MALELRPSYMWIPSRASPLAMYVGGDRVGDNRVRHPSSCSYTPLQRKVTDKAVRFLALLCLTLFLAYPASLASPAFSTITSSPSSTSTAAAASVTWSGDVLLFSTHMLVPANNVRTHPSALDDPLPQREQRLPSDHRYQRCKLPTRLKF
ncbi:hypothetical protein FB451DRAFT_1396517 [Mycena latifolia]|nr:hypothetical protein FB451DRAFT_1396517 [Mycena latifolia]